MPFSLTYCLLPPPFHAHEQNHLTNKPLKPLGSPSRARTHAQARERKESGEALPVNKGSIPETQPLKKGSISETQPVKKASISETQSGEIFVSGNLKLQETASTRHTVAYSILVMRAVHTKHHPADCSLSARGVFSGLPSSCSRS